MVNFPSYRNTFAMFVRLVMSEDRGAVLRTADITRQGFPMVPQCLHFLGARILYAVRQVLRQGFESPIA
jgi:hypothetical protein